MSIGNSAYKSKYILKTDRPMHDESIPGDDNRDHMLRVGYALNKSTKRIEKVALLKQGKMINSRDVKSLLYETERCGLNGLIVLPNFVYGMTDKTASAIVENFDRLSIVRLSPRKFKNYSVIEL